MSGMFPQLLFVRWPRTATSDAATVSSSAVRTSVRCQRAILRFPHNPRSGKRAVGPAVRLLECRWHSLLILLQRLPGRTDGGHSGNTSARRTSPLCARIRSRYRDMTCQYVYDRYVVRYCTHYVAHTLLPSMRPVVHRLHGRHNAHSCITWLYKRRTWPPDQRQAVALLLPVLGDRCLLFHLRC